MQNRHDLHINDSVQQASIEASSKIDTRSVQPARSTTGLIRNCIPKKFGANQFPSHDSRACMNIRIEFVWDKNRVSLLLCMPPSGDVINPKSLPQGKKKRGKLLESMVAVLTLRPSDCFIHLP